MHNMVIIITTAVVVIFCAILVIWLALKRSGKKIAPKTIVKIGCLVLIGVALFSGCVASCVSDNDDHPAYDEDGLGGYSDDFWEWQSKQ